MLSVLSITIELLKEFCKGFLLENRTYFVSSIQAIDRVQAVLEEAKKRQPAVSPLKAKKQEPLAASNGQQDVAGSGTALQVAANGTAHDR